MNRIRQATGPTHSDAKLARVLIRDWHTVEYSPTLEAMRAFTARRGAHTPDELWLVEHPPVFTQGLAGKAEHLLAPGEIPVIATERGGQVTYHGPGQVIAYLLLDLHRRGLGPRALVNRIESAVISLLATYGVAAIRKPGAPGVYVQQLNGEAGAKIAALGIKVSRGCSYHGVALNVSMDLEPFERINPCGYPGQAVTDLQRSIGGTSFGDRIRIAAVAAELGEAIAMQLDCSQGSTP